MMFSGSVAIPAGGGELLVGCCETHSVKTKGANITNGHVATIYYNCRAVTIGMKVKTKVVLLKAAVNASGRDEDAEADEARRRQHDGDGHVQQD